MRNFIYLLCMLVIGSFSTACSGSECSASADFLDDIDSDCADDSGDNCVGTYNPDQFDGDEDGIGYACDADDTVDGSVSALLSLNTEFNMAGFYEFANSCENFTALKIEQSQNKITATDEFENIYQGLAHFDSENLKISGSLKNTNQTCDFIYDPFTNSMHVNCGCEFLGEKTFTHLRTE